MEVFDKVCQMYLDNMAQDELSSDTQEGYARTFDLYRRFLASNGFSGPCAEATALFKAEKGRSLTTVYLYLTHLRLLCRYGMDLGLFPDNFVPDSLFPNRKKVASARKRGYGHVLTEGQLSQLVSAERPTYTRKSPTWLREKAIVTVFLFSGLRNSELRALSPSDLDWENGVIHARITKGDKPRYVSFPAAAQQAVRAYLDSGLRPADAGADAPLFGCVSRSGAEWKALGRTQLSGLIYNYTRGILGDEIACRTHALRHGFASAALTAGVSIADISASLGHANFSTTSIYAQNLKPEAAVAGIGLSLERSFSLAATA